MLFIFLTGLFIGSFLNVCIYRIPRGESILYPPSHCPTCDAKLKAKDLVPILSYLFQKGRCRYCGEKISLQYPLIEALNALVYLLLYLKFGLTVSFLKYAFISSLLIVISVIDYYHKIIPDKTIICGFMSVIVFITLYNFKGNIINGTLGLLVGGGFFLLISVVTNGGIGGGDIKLMALLGFLLGWKEIILTSVLSFFIGAIISIILILLKIKGRKDYIPFGPFISVSAFITIYFGNEILGFYISTFIN